MAQDTTPAIIVYQGDGSNSVFDVPFDKGYYGDIKVLFVRRGLADYTYNPNTFTVSGRLYAWQNGGAKIYTHTPNPAIGAPTYNSSDVEQAETVSAIAGQTITVDSLVYSRAVQHDISSNMKLTWTGDMLEVGDFICIVRDTERGQPYEMPNNQKHIERALDNIERQVQEVKDATDNALKIDPSHDIPDSHKMNPIDWLKSIIRCMDFSVRAVRLVNGWFDYSTDDPNIDDADKTWVHLLNTDNIKAVREQSRIEDGETIYWTEYLAQDGTWKTLSDPHKWDNMKLSDLVDIDFTNLSAGNFIMFDGLKWKNVYSSATASWGTILGDITAQTDLMNKFTEYVRTDGTSVMTNPLMMRATDDFKCAIAPYWDGVGFFKLNDNNSVTLMASIEYNSGFEPATTNTYNIGASARKWKNLYLSGKAYMSVINNGYDIAVPVTNSPQTLALKSEVDLAANSGDQLTEKGVWYAKMYSATVAPSAEDGTNYADFSQVDGQGNPIIVIYKRQNGAWVQDQTITPPAEYNGYVPVTSKIWDIVEQAGQQGGKVLWSHNQKTFTPSPLIISFKDAALTGTPTAPTLNASSPSDQIVNKQALENALVNHGTGRNVGDIFYTMRNDNELNGAVECDGATYNTTDFTGAQSIGALLAAGKIPYLSLADYATALATDGSVGVFGWDGGNTTTFRVPSLNDIFVETGTATQIGVFVPAGAPNITGKFSVTNAASGPKGNINATGGCVYADGKTSGAYSAFAGDGSSASGPKVAHIDASRSSSVYGNSDTVQPKSVRYRAMVQLATSASDEAVETCTGVLADVAALKYDYVVDFQAPTAENNYTWYRKYKSGWVEQGGIIPINTSSVTLLVEMADANYMFQATGYKRSDTNTMTWSYISSNTQTTTGFTIASSGGSRCWEVKGMAAS